MGSSPSPSSDLLWPQGERESTGLGISPWGLVILKVRQRWKLDISPRGAGYKHDTDWSKRMGKLRSQRAGAVKMVQNKIGSHGLV